MIEGGSLGAHIAEHAKIGIAGSFQVIDDGTYLIFYYAGVKIFKIKKSDGDFYIEGDFHAQETL